MTAHALPCLHRRCSFTAVAASYEKAVDSIRAHDVVAHAGVGYDSTVTPYRRRRCLWLFAVLLKLTPSCLLKP